MHLIIVTGMSGAGKSQALNKLEDIGFYCVDNLPLNLVLQLVEMLMERNDITRIALGIDSRSTDFDVFPELFEKLRELDVCVESVFLDSADEVLVKRYSESRRNHPMARMGVVQEGIDKERKTLENMRRSATYYIDTSDMKPSQLYAEIEMLCKHDRGKFLVIMRSFGFKRGIPPDADIVIDVRFLPNPYWEEGLKTLTGKDRPVIDYVMGFGQTIDFLKDFSELLAKLIPEYKAQAKQRLVIAIGCTGGQHRSVCIAEELANRLKAETLEVLVSHRDIPF